MNLALLKHPLFEGLSSREMRTLFAHEHVSTYPKGQSIFYEGTHPSGLYFVLRGKAKIFKKGLWNHEQIVRLAGPGDLLTLRAVAGTPQYVVSATALEESKILFIDLNDFFAVLKSNAAFSFKILELLARELDHAENRIRDFAQKNVRQRLADLLLYLGDSYGTGAEGAIDVRLSREELANVIGTSTETVVRLLAEFRDKEIIELNAREIHLLDREKLEKTAHPDRIAPLLSLVGEK